MHAAVGGHEAAARLDDQVHPGQHGVGALEAERGDIAHDEPRVARGQGGVVEPQLAGQSGPEIGEHHVRARKEGLDHPRSRGVPEVERQRVLPPVAREEVARLPRREGVERAHRVALQRLDLDDVRPAVGEELRAVRHRDELAELNDFNTLEGLGAVTSDLSHLARF